jgi:hypothetical protein
MNGSDDAAAWWTSVLDEFESVLVDHRCRLDSMTSDDPRLVDVPRFVPPMAVPPMPTTIRPRAIALSRRADELVADVSLAAAQIKPLAAAPRARAAASTATSSGFDELA